MYTMSCSALERQDADFREMVMSCFRSSVAISPAKKSVTAMFAVACDRRREAVANPPILICLKCINVSEVI